MKLIKRLTPLLALMLLLLAACTPSGSGGESIDPTAPAPEPTTPVSTPDNDGEENSAIGEAVSEQTLFVLPYMRQCVGVGPQLCMLVADSEQADPGFFYDQIEGFTFEWGTAYELRVAVTEIENPPADASSLRYELLEVVSSEPAAGESIELSFSTDFVTPLDNGRFQIGSAGEFLCELEDCAQLAELANESGDLTLFLEYPAVSGDPLILLNWVGSFADADAPADTASSRWILTLLNGRNLLPDTEITLQTDEGQIGGSAGCNQYGGEGTLKGSVVNLGELAITEKACIQPDGVMEQEGEFIAALLNSSRYEEVDDTLTLFAESGELTLQFVRDTAVAADNNSQPLTNLLWTVVAYGDGAQATFPVVGSEPTFAFDEDGQLAIFTGCNQATAGYTIEDETISLTAIATTLMACADPAINEQEQALLALLPQMSQLSLGENSLILTDESGDNIISLVTETADSLQPPLTLNSHAWQLASFVDGDAVSSTVNGSEVTAVFNPNQGTLSGNAGCNNYTAPVTLGDDDSLTVGLAATTRMICPEPIMDQERQYLQQLEQVASYTLTDSQLTLLDADGNPLLQFIPLS